jgi:ABC-type nitrate/sulfonate/bicarbonate transport system permease component
VQRSKRRMGLAIQAASIFVFLGIWQLTGLFLNPILFSTPVAVVGDFVHMLFHGPLLAAFWDSLWEMALGFGIALVLGVGSGILMGIRPGVERTLDPFVNLANATPTIALLPAMEIWFGIGLWARVGFIIVISVCPLVINTLVGMKTVQGGYRDVGRAFGLTDAEMTRKILIPAAMPYIVAGIRVALYHATVGMILSGQEVEQAGLGGLTQTYGSYSQTGHLIAAIICTTALAMLAFAALRRFQSRFYPWIQAVAAEQR